MNPAIDWTQQWPGGPVHLKSDLPCRWSKPRVVHVEVNSLRNPPTDTGLDLRLPWLRQMQVTCLVHGPDHVMRQEVTVNDPDERVRFWPPINLVDEWSL